MKPKLNSKETKNIRKRGLFTKNQGVNKVSIIINSSRFIAFAFCVLFMQVFTTVSGLSTSPGFSKRTWEWTTTSWSAWYHARSKALKSSVPKGVATHSHSRTSKTGIPSMPGTSILTLSKTWNRQCSPNPKGPQILSPATTRAAHSLSRFARTV